MTDRAIDQAVGLGDDDARPNDADPQADTSPAPAPAAAYDPDLAELQAAQAAVEAEQRGAAAAPDAGQQQAAAAPEATQQPPSQGQPPKPKAVPYERFAEATRRRQEAEQRAAYLEGALAERGRQPGTTTPDPAAAAPPPAAPSADPITTQVKEARVRLRTEAERFDRGEITLAEFESVRGEVDDRIAELNLARVQQTQQRQPDSLADQAIEQTHLNTLYARHPYAASLNDQQAHVLAQMAQANLAMQGKPIQNGSKAETLRLREAVAALSDTFGPAWGVKPSAPVQHQQTKPAAPLSPAASARAAKIALADSLPPDPAGFGMGAPADLSEDRIATMSDEEIGALPAHIRNRVLQSTA